MIQKPVAIGLFLCDQVVIAEATRHVTPVNCFTMRRVEGLPSDPSPFVVFAILTDGLGETQLEVAIQRLDNLEEVYRRGAPFHFADPLQEVRCLFRVRDCSFPIPGYYEARLFADNESIAQRKFRILLSEDET
jgi:hypothetical protein